MDGRTDGRTDSPCVLQDFVPFGAAALLPLNLNHVPLKQGTGTADHLLPLGCYSALRYPSGTLTYQLFPSSVAGDEEMVNKGLGPLGAL